MTLQVGDLIPIGGSGNVKKSEVLEGKTYSSDEGTDLVGTMPNHDTLSKTITTQGGTQKISPGYYEGGEIKAQFSNLTSSNIKKGVNVGGVVGNYQGEITRTLAMNAVLAYGGGSRSTTVTAKTGDIIVAVNTYDDWGVAMIIEGASRNYQRTEVSRDMIISIDSHYVSAQTHRVEIYAKNNYGGNQTVKVYHYHN